MKGVYAPAPFCGRRRPFSMCRFHFLRSWCVSAALASAVLPACDNEAKDARKGALAYSENARAAYTKALQAFAAKDWEEAKPLFEDVKKQFPYSPYARQAELRLADISFEQEKYADSAAAYRDFLQKHHADRDAEYARYRTVKALFKDVDETFFLPPLEERDQSTTLDAYKEILTFMREFPRTRYRTDVEYMREVTTGRLVRHELYVARYYLRADNLDAAVARCDEALKKYPNSGLDAEALVLKGETLLKLGRKEEAKEAFMRVIREYGGPFATTAKSFLAVAQKAN